MIGKLRSVNTKIWNDLYFIELSVPEKLIFLYLITCPQSSLAGVYEIHTKTISNHTEVPVEEVVVILEKFQSDKKVLYKHGHIILKNTNKNNAYNGNMMINVQDTLNNLPKKILEDEECQKFLAPINSALKGYLKPSKDFENKKENKKGEDEIKKVIKKEDVLSVFNWWNSQKIWVHKSLNKDMETQIKRKLSQFTLQEILDAIKRYATVFSDETWYFDTKWDLGTFLRRKNGFPDFLDEGVKWVNYFEQTEKKKTPPEQETNLNISFLRMKILYSPNKHTKEDEAKRIWSSYDDKTRERIYETIKIFKESSVYKDKEGQYRRSLFSYLNEETWREFERGAGEKELVLRKAIEQIKSS